MVFFELEKVLDFTGAGVRPSALRSTIFLVDPKLNDILKKLNRDARMIEPIGCKRAHITAMKV
ncbi:hypothetical protein L914_02982 [Phytophthora nicotianae]|uniref:Uncharacterized protein n=1 Tax=Phytophthora nicotianae TaxID=4792 RepID=W2NYA5_PHYNI|nr:hypothetical protein L914_02982 [Phytophthora nicotianae]